MCGNVRPEEGGSRRDRCDARACARGRGGLRKSFEERAPCLALFRGATQAPERHSASDERLFAQRPLGSGGQITFELCERRRPIALTIEQEATQDDPRKKLFRRTGKRSLKLAVQD